MVVPKATDINIDPKCDRIKDLDMALISSLGSDITMAQVAAQATQVSITPAVGWPPGPK